MTYSGNFELEDKISRFRLKEQDKNEIMLSLWGPRPRSILPLKQKKVKSFETTSESKGFKSLKINEFWNARKTQKMRSP